LVDNVESSCWLLPPLAKRFLRRKKPEVVGKTGELLADEVYALSVENGDDYKRFPKLEEAWPQIEAGLPLLLEGDNQQLQDLCWALGKFLNFSGRWDERISLCLKAEIKAVQSKDWNNAGWRAYNVGRSQFLRGNASEVYKIAKRVLDHWEKGGAGLMERATGLELRGIGHRLAGAFEESLADYQESLRLFRNRTPKSRAVARILNTIGSIMREMGRYDEAEFHYRKSQVIAEKVFSKVGIANCIGNLADLELDRENWPEAEHLAREALVLQEDIGRKERVGTNCYRLARALARQGRRSEGVGYAERAVAIFSGLRIPELKEAQEALEECRQ